MKLSLGPILYYWPREKLKDFYSQASKWPVDIVYLGETVCSRRHEFRIDDWMTTAEMLAASGKEVVFSTQALIESESDLRTLRRFA
ncbi:MAG: U32 family peptidase, partial [Nitrosomonadales bacterium]|nr:U32 family peptidase [Nitrosomonadales bacterium]